MGYNYYKSLKRKNKELKHFYGEGHSSEIFKILEENSKSLMDISERAMPMLNGYKNLNEYYEAINISDHLHKIKVPTFFLNALDDPTINPTLYPFNQF